jgi:alpha-tubulin suppressor-like RCC1 family protein
MMACAATVAALLAALAVPMIAAAGAPAAASAGRAGGPGRSAATATDTLRAWGFNENGQLGDATTTSRRRPVKVQLPPGTTITSVRSGCFHTLALTRTGRVLAWGANDSGQLGNGTFTSSMTPVKVSIPLGTTITAIRAGCDYSLALTAGGKVLAWGGGLLGQLGDGVSGTDSARNAPVRVLLGPGTTVRAISAGADHALALTATGRVLAWGYNNNGQLGDGTMTSVSNRPVHVRLGTGVRATAVTAGGSHSLALTSTGRLLSWGSNDRGQLGNGSTSGSHVPIPVKLPEGTKVRGLFAGCQDTLAQTSTGKVLAWGAGDVGQLGNGRAADRHRPVRVRLPKGSKVTAISAGCQHSLALTASGHVLAWGFNGDGELGNGTLAGRSVPVRVRLAAGLTAIAIGSGPISKSSWAIVRR